MRIIWHAVWQNVGTRFRYPVWMYLLLPLAAIVLEFGLAIPKVILRLFGV